MEIKKITTQRNVRVFDYNVMMMPVIMDNGDSAVVSFERPDSWAYNECCVSVIEANSVPNNRKEYEELFLQEQGSAPWRRVDDIAFVVLNDDFDTMTFDEFCRKYTIEDMIG